MSAEVTVAWDQTQYAAAEGDVVSVCAYQLQLSELAFTVNIQSSPSDGNCSP